MPFVTITLFDSVAAAERRAIADGVHRAIVQAGFPEADRFQRIIPLSKDDFIFDRTHPNLPVPRSDRFVLVEILLSAGRSVEFKRDLLSAIAANVRRDPGLDPHDVMVVLIETARENWSFANGVQTYVAAGTA
jgi:phenylpyruvate tautomerase PptA (4-oxalocrotonate tautomerase family)